MTRIDLVDTLKRCGLTVTPHSDGRMTIDGYKPLRMTEAQAFQVVDHLAKSHCLSCGRPFEDEEQAG